MNNYRFCTCTTEILGGSAACQDPDCQAAEITSDWFLQILGLCGICLKFIAVSSDQIVPAPGYIEENSEYWFEDYMYLMFKQQPSEGFYDL